MKHGILGFAQYLKKDSRVAGKDFLSKYDKMYHMLGFKQGKNNMAGNWIIAQGS